MACEAFLVHISIPHNELQKFKCHSEQRCFIEKDDRLRRFVLNEQLGFQHPVHAEWKHISFCQFAGPLAEENGELVGPNAVCVRPGKIDRSPTGTGCSARMAVLHAQGRMRVGDRYRARSIIGSEFECGIDSVTSVGEINAIVPTVSGRAWITGMHQLMLDPDDPWPEGYRLADTWPLI